MSCLRNEQRRFPKQSAAEQRIGTDKVPRKRTDGPLPLNAVLYGHGRMILALLLTALPKMTPTGMASEPDKGSICIAGLREPSTEPKGLGNPSGGNPEPNYSVEIDRHTRISVPRIDRGGKAGVLVGGLDPKVKHLITLRHKGRRIESFYFEFPSDDLEQCLFLNDLYLTWQVWPVKRNRSCKCV
jgi:hypothetical protein